MNSLEVLGAALIWCSVGALVLLFTAIAWELIVGFIRRRLVQRAVWRIRDEFVDQEMLDDLVSYESEKWWKHHERERVWCRATDFQEGMRAAAKHLVRMHSAITLVRRRPDRRVFKIDTGIPTPDELKRIRAIMRRHRLEE